MAIDPSTVPSDLRRPGHIFPLRARPGGVLQRVGQTEASIDLARLAGLYPAGVICEILNPDGSMARRHDGIGLGLALVRKLTTVLGGTVAVTSRVAEGSTFTVTLPLRSAVARAAAAPDAP